VNERIEQLAGQLGPVATVGDWGRVEWADNVYPQRGDKMYAAVDLAKFAELIVRECANVCRDDGRWFQEQDDKVEAGVAYALCYKIKQHFRVEQ